jgi:hypothetical protein
MQQKERPANSDEKDVREAPLPDKAVEPIVRRIALAWQADSPGAESGDSSLFVH